MKKMLVFLLTVGLLLTQAAVYAQSDQTSTGAPPVAQPLVREGDLAVKLVDSLKIGTAKNEAEAETMLGSFGIAPKNGWTADYPVTPDIIGELQSAIANAADTKRLPMGRDEALRTFGKLSADLGLPVTAETGKYAEGQPPKSYEYTSPGVVNNYYYEEGPPVVTYYPPPWDYWYLYSWVPFPFFFSGFFFSGFFALHDFHRVVIFANRVVVVSNHVISPINRTVVVIDPPARSSGKAMTSTSAVAGKTATSRSAITGKTATTTSAVAGKTATSPSTVTGKTATTRSVSQGGRPSGFTSPEARKAATSILERSQQRLGSSSMTRMTGQTKPFSTASGAPSASSRTMGANQGQTRNTTINQRSSGGGGRSVNTPNVFHGRSSSGPSMSRTFGSSGRSFSPPSGSFSAPRGSSEGFHGGGFSGSHSSGGFSGGHSFGGFSGGHGGFSGGRPFSGGFSGGGGGFHGGGHR